MLRKWVPDVRIGETKRTSTVVWHVVARKIQKSSASRTCGIIPRENYRRSTHLAVLGREPVATVTFPAAGHHRPLTGTKSYCLLIEARVCHCEQLAQGCYVKLGRSRLELFSAASLERRESAQWRRRIEIICIWGILSILNIFVIFISPGMAAA